MRWRKYGAAFKFRAPVIKAGVSDFAVGADWTPATGDVKISKDGGAAANLTSLPTAIVMGNGAIWEFSVTATEAQAAEITITVVDSATKAVQDQAFEINTYGSSSGLIATGWTDAGVKKNAALPALEFVMTDSTTHQPKTGLTVAATRSIDGGAFSSCANSPSEVANGTYTLDLAAGDLNGGVITLRLTAASADDLLVTIITQP